MCIPADGGESKQMTVQFSHLGTCRSKMMNKQDFLLPPAFNNIVKVSVHCFYRCSKWNIIPSVMLAGVALKWLPRFIASLLLDTFIHRS